MAEILSRSNEIIEQLEKEEKIVVLDQQDDLDAISRIDNYMELIQRDFQIKERESNSSASRVFLTA